MAKQHLTKEQKEKQDKEFQIEDTKYQVTQAIDNLIKLEGYMATIKYLQTLISELIDKNNGKEQI